MKSTSFVSRITLALAFTACLTVLTSEAQTSFSLTPLATFGTRGDGSIQPGDTFYVDSGFNQRGIAFDPVSTNLVFVDTHSGQNGSAGVLGSIFILDGSTGANISTLNTNGISGGSYADAPAIVADDGVVYVCNQVTTSGTLAFNIYRWDSVTSIDPPLKVFSSTITPTQRYGGSVDIRGAGTNTQIIIGSMVNGTTSGTNVVIFTTADGTNFTANVLATDVTSANFNDGIAFGLGNTFWAKRIGSPLRLMSFNLTTSNAVTLASYDSSALPNSDNLGPIAVDNTNHLLAAIEVITGSQEHVRLYDISNSNQAPSLLDIKDFVPNIANATAPPGYLDFGNGTLYAYVVNNGLIAYSLSSAATPPPTILQQPPATNRVTVGRTVSMSVLSYPAVNYQWQSNNVPIPSATNSTLTLLNVQTNYSALYTCIVSNAGGTQTINSQLIVVNPNQLFHLNLQWSAAPNSRTYFTTNGETSYNVPNVRSIGFNSHSNQLYIPFRDGSAGTTYHVYVVNGANGNLLYELKTNGMYLNVVSHVSGQNGAGLCSIGVADDGAVYACNTSPNALGDIPPNVDTNGYFRVWRWANGDSNTVPVQIWFGDPAYQSSRFRWGDVLSVRGSGTNTQILLDNSDNTARYVAILSPTDATLTNWTSTYFFNSVVGAGLGRSLEFEVGNNISQKRRGGALVQSSFDLTAIYPGNIMQMTSSNATFTNTLAGLGLDNNRHLAAGVNVASVAAPDTLNLYEISDPNAPLLIFQYNFPLTHAVAGNLYNANFFTETFFTGDQLFTFDANNGIMAFKVAIGPPTAPNFLIQPSNLRLIQGGAGTFSIVLDQQADVQWQRGGTNVPGATNLTFVITNATLADAADYRAIATNQYGSSTSLVATAAIYLPQDNYSLSNVWSLAPLSRPYLRNDSDSAGQTPLYRSIAYNALSNQVYIISRSSAAGGLAVNVLDADSAADLYTLDTTGIAGGSIVLLMMRAADDGALYAGNMDTSAATNAFYNLYRWADSGPATQPVQVYSGDPSGLGATFRWGDTIAIRGSGTNTQIALDNLQGTYGAILAPTDSSMTTFTNLSFHEGTPSSPIGRSLQFASSSSNLLWQKRSGGGLQLTSFDLNAQNGNSVSNFNAISSTLGPVAIDSSRHLLAGISFSTTSADSLQLYDVSDFNTPLLIASYSFPITPRKPNGNQIGDIVFAGNRIYAVDGNNGVVAFDIIAPSKPQVGVALSGSDLIITWPTNFPGYTLYSRPAPDFAPGNEGTAVGAGAIVGSQYTITNSASGAGQFFRLSRPKPNFTPFP